MKKDAVLVQTPNEKNLISRGEKGKSLQLVSYLKKSTNAKIRDF